MDTRVNPTAFGLMGAAVSTVLYPLMEDRRGIVFFGAFSGLILLAWVAGLAIFGPQAWLDVAEAKLATYPDGTSILTVRHTDAAVAAASLRAEYGGTLPPLTQVAGQESSPSARRGTGPPKFGQQPGIAAVIGGANLSYRVERGITFFEIQRYSLLGLQIQDVRITPDLNYSWRFSVDELRYPVVRMVTSAGWTWGQAMPGAPWLSG